jgi:hypothetical protein
MEDGTNNKHGVWGHFSICSRLFWHWLAAPDKAYFVLSKAPWCTFEGFLSPQKPALI